MAFRRHWRRRWHVCELGSSQYCCDMNELAADWWVWSAKSVLSCAESVREEHSVLPCDFPVKSGSWIYFINVGIHLLVCSRKLCCVLDFGDFCSWRCNFWVGMYDILMVALWLTVSLGIRGGGGGILPHKVTNLFRFPFRSCTRMKKIFKSTL